MGKPRKAPTKTLINNINNASLSLSLPKEVEPEILKGLPVKTLLQFRSVSKNWQSIIDNPSFAHTHFSNAETRLGGSRILLSFSNSDGSRYYLYSVGVFGGRAIHHLTLPSANYNDNDNDTLLVRSKCYFLPPVKGLVCFFNGKNVFVCNPSTRKFRTLPLCPTNYNKTSQNSYFYKPYSSYSFGYDSCSNVFKILHVYGTICRDDNRLYNVESRVLTIKTPDEFKLDSFSWRKIASSFPYPYPFRTQGVFVNGCIYWVGLRAPGEENIVSFDIKEEKFRLISSPSNGVPSSSKLVNIGEKLGIMCYKTYGDFSLEVLVYTNCTWVKIDVGSYVALKKKKGMSTNFAAFVGNDYTGAMLLTPGVLLHDFVLRSLNNGRERGIKISGLPGWIDFLDYKKINYSVYNYVESIVPLDLVIRLGDFAVDLANVKLVKLMPRLVVEMCKEWKSGDLVFGDVEEFEKKKKEELVKKSYAEAAAKRLVKKERKKHSGDKYKRK
ncbi:F-box protein At1g30790 [Beta vulgaris subsp. vulgaris]|uniref:F-box protein At1g30790 n=1 Tax=Beta vulgaris subsp. vulgaris TaxID=3555 RepID=UPI0020369FF1|nr:F-box protein At1g30790 [Beta vulgaris subsp. vulgaris]